MSPSKPEPLASLPPERLVHLDVREYIRRDEEPFDTIMATVKRLAPDQVLVLHVPFEPIPLYHVLGRHGFTHWAESCGPDDWTVYFWRPGADLPGQLEQRDATAGGGQPLRAPEPPPVATVAAGEAGHPPPAATVAAMVVDVRGMEPPHPMLRVLELLDTLAPGERLVVIHERRPIFLYPQLEEQGFHHATEERGPGEVRITIWRGGSGA